MAKKAHSRRKSDQVVVSKQAKDRDQRSAIDQLHAQAETQKADAPEKREYTFDALQMLEREALELIAKTHRLGDNITGWKNPYPLDDPRCVLLEYGDRYIKDQSRFKDALWPRQSGKDFNSEGEVSIDLHQRQTQWLIAAPSERQSLDSFEQLKTWVAAWKLKIDDYNEAREGTTSEHLLKSAVMKLSNGSLAEAVPGRPDTVRGKSRNTLITEADFLEDALATIRALLPSISNPLRGGEKKLRYISTPNGVGNLMHKTRTQPSGKMQWSHHTLNILQAVLMGLPVDWEVLIEAFGDDHEGVRQELFCEFLDGSNVLLPYDLIQQSESLEATEAWDPAISLRNSSETFVGVDFGRQNDPTVAWTLQRVGGALWTREVLVLQRTDTPEQERQLRDRIAASRRTCFDYTGPGIGLGDYLVKAHGEWDPEKHQMGKVELCTFTRAFKCELFPKLRRAFEASMPNAGLIGTKGVPIRIPVSRIIREDLHAVTQTQNGGQYNYWSPRTKNGHSDRCTALALAVRAAGEGGGPFGYASGGERPRGRRVDGL